MDTKTCTHCGTEVSPASVGGMCPACLLEAGFGNVADADDSSSLWKSGEARPTVSGAPSRIGDYELLHEIARGGQGVVYRARHTKLKREVALKLFPLGPWATASQVQRLRTEAQVTADLDHPAIVPIYEIGEAHGQHFFAMKLIDGVSLNRLSPEKMPAPRAAAALIAHCARAIQHAHERGVLHRDLKPGNILLDAHGQPHITDFGLAKILAGSGDDNAVTQPLEMLGTPSYISPEMAAGGAQPLGVAADVYGLGAVLYHLLTGRPPFAGASALETLRQVSETVPVPPRRINPAVGRDFELICLKCLEKDPARRYATAAALADDLEQALRGEGIAARPASVGYRLRTWIRRHRAATGVLAALLAVGFVAMVWWRLNIPAHLAQLDRVERLINALDAVPDDLQLAEDIMEDVIAQRPADPAVVTLMARVQGQFPFRGVDRSDARFASVRRFAERAVQLAPDDPGALGALALYHYTQRDDSARARALVERAIARRPDDPVLRRLEVAILINAPDVPFSEAIAEAGRNAARFPDDALTHYQLAQFLRDDGRLADMETHLDRAIVLGPVPNALVWKAHAALWLRGNVAEMRTWLDRVPSRIRTTERVVLARWAEAMAGGNYDEGYHALEKLPQAWVEDWSFVGPKHLLSGQLLALADQPVRARHHFEHALTELRQRQAREPAESGYRRLEVWILLGQGRVDEARALFRTDVVPTLRRPQRIGPLTSWWFRALPCALLLGERDTALALLREAVEPADVEGGELRYYDYEVSHRATAAELRATIRLRLRLDPRMAPWRDDPEIAALLREP